MNITMRVMGLILVAMAVAFIIGGIGIIIIENIENIESRASAFFKQDREEQMEKTGEREIPEIDGHWLLGSLFEFKNSPHKFLAKSAPKGHGLVQFRIFNRKTIGIVDVDCAEAIFKHNSRNYPRGKGRKPLESLLGRGLITLEGDKWKIHRRLLAQGFKPESLQYSLDHNSELVASLLDEWQQNATADRPIDIVEQMRRITLSVIIKALFSVDLDLDDNQRLYSAILNANTVLFKRYVAPVTAPDWIPTPLNRQLAETREAMNRFSEQQLKAKLANPNRQTKDIVDYFLDLNDAGEMTLEEIYDEIRTLLVAGFETTAASLAWTLYLIAKNPQVTQRWHQELDEHLGSKPPSWENIGKLKYTEHIFMEGLRLYPPVYMMTRTSLEDDCVKGYSIPAGRIVLLSIYGIQRSPAYWEKPDEFIPERFEGDWPQQAYFPFGIGKHICIGNRFAMLEAILILACIGQRFRLSLQDDEEVEGNARVTLTPGREIPVNLEARR